MKIITARVTENEQAYGNTQLTWLAAPEVARSAVPGQFVMLRCAEPDGVPAADPLLPRPMSIHRIREGAAGPEWAVLYNIVGRGTAWLASRRVGDSVICWGPLGRGYSVRRSSDQLLLVAGGIGIAPLVWMADEAVAGGKNVTIVIGGRSASQVYPARLLPAEVEVVVLTEDGSLGIRGLATDAFVSRLDWCDQAFACGPNPMFRTMAEELRRAGSRKPVQVLLEERMGCGTGMCYGCTVNTRRGLRLVCRDGPRFDLRDIF